MSTETNKPLDPKIEQKEAIRVVGLKRAYRFDNGENLAEIPKLWTQISQDGTEMKLMQLMDQAPNMLLGISTNMREKDFDYFIAVPSNKPVPEGMEEFQIPAAQWAVFGCIGPMPTSIQQTMTQITNEWLPNCPYKYMMGPDIEAYPTGNINADDYCCEVWLRIENK